MIDSESKDSMQNFRTFFIAHKPGIGFLLVCLSFLVSGFIGLDIWSLYTKFASTQPRPTIVNSLLYQYSSLRGVSFARFYLMLSLYVFIILCFTAGSNFMQEVDTPHLLYRFNVSTLLFIVFILVNAFPTCIILICIEPSSSLNVRDQLLLLMFFFLMTAFYYVVFQNPAKRFQKRLLIIGLVVIPFGFFIELAGFFLIITAPHA